ncbi:two-component regulator propeller domain-containing protein [Geofilum sp. OHC36d9]|uniref:two-component regulator propeller domain-containing protein n=1 Tax=Geofilum sp. OHC36d9 TaxID=3458413 RepID=UPI00403409DC
MVYIKYLIILIIEVFFIQMGYSLPLNKLKIKNVDNSQGLANNHVLCVTQDSRGIIWIGTYSGVQIFDGYDFDFISKTADGREVFSNNVIYAIVEDNDRETMWFGTEFGLNSYNIKTGKVTQIVSGSNKNNNLGCNCLRDIYIDKDGLLWLASYGGGLTVYDKTNGKFENYKAIPGDSSSLQSNYINSLYVDRQGLLWIATENGGLSIFDMRKRKIVSSVTNAFKSLSNSIINCVFQDYADNYWIGTWNSGLWRYKFKDNSLVSFECFLDKCETIRSIEQSDKDFLWVATFGGGLYKFYTEEERFEKCELVQSDLKNTKQDFIWDVFNDDNGNIWISTFGSGVFMINKEHNRFPSYSLRDELSHTLLSVSCCFEDQGRRLWIGTYDGGVYIFNSKNGTYTKLDVTSKLNINDISCIFQDSKKRMWLAGKNSLVVLMPDLKTYKYFTHDPENRNSLPLSKINSIIEDDDENIWLGICGEGIRMVAAGDMADKNDRTIEFKELFSSEDTLNTIPNNKIWNLQKDVKGNIWIGSPDKLTCYDIQSKQFNRFEIYSASSMYEDKLGNLWVTSMGKGLYKLDRNYHIEKLFNISNGLPSLILVGVIADKKGRLWIGTNQGISVLDPETEQVLNFNRSQGLGFNEVNINAFALLQSGDMIFGGNEGFSLFYPETIGADAFNGKTCIDKIEVMHKPIHCDQRYRDRQIDTTVIQNVLLCDIDTLLLDYNDKVLTLSFCAINYSNPLGLYFSYKLEGFDKQWIISKAYRSATYTNLPPGEYFFKVRSSYDLTNWESDKTLLIIINGFFWQQYWFKVGVALLLGVIIVICAIKYLEIRKRVVNTQSIRVKNRELIAEQNDLKLHNEQLKETNKVNQNKIASLVNNTYATDQKVKMLYENLKELEQSDPSLLKSKLKSVINSIHNRSAVTTNSDNELDTTVNILFDDFQTKLAQQYPKLTQNDLRICSYIRMNKSNKDIAQMLNIALSSLETSRYRIRKKLCLESEINLNDFLIRF